MLPADPGTVFWLAGIMVSVILGGATWAWNHTHKRIDSKADSTVLEAVKKIEHQIEVEVSCFRRELLGKASDSEMSRQRGHIENLFKGQEQIRSDMNTGFQLLQSKMSDTHIILLDKLNEIGRKPSK